MEASSSGIVYIPVRLMIGLALYFFIRPAKGSPRSATNTGRQWSAWACVIALVGIHVPSASSIENTVAMYAVGIALSGGIAFAIGAFIGKAKLGETTRSTLLQHEPLPVATSMHRPMPRPSAQQAPEIETLTQADEYQIYAQIATELESDNHDKATWTKAYALCDGDERKTRSTYIKLRFSSLSALQPDTTVPASPLDSKIAISSTGDAEPGRAEEPQKPPPTVQSEPNGSPETGNGVVHFVTVIIVLTICLIWLIVLSLRTTPVSRTDINGKIDSELSASPATSMAMDQLKVPEPVHHPITNNVNGEVAKLNLPSDFELAPSGITRAELDRFIRGEEGPVRFTTNYSGQAQDEANRKIREAEGK